MPTPPPSPRPHILFLPRWYPNRYDPMLGLFVRNHAVVASDIARISVVYVHAVKNTLSRTEIEFQDDQGVLTWRIYYPVPGMKLPLIGPLYKLLRYIRANRQGIRMAWRQQGKPLLIHVHVLTRLGIIALSMKWLCRIPYVVTEHWSRYLPSVNTFNGPLRKVICRLVVRKAEAITTPTANLRDAMLKHRLVNPCYNLLPNLVDASRFTPGESIRTGKGSIEFIHVSCFEDKSKNISGLLRAISHLGGKRSDFKCRLIGTGEDYDRLVHLAEELRIRDRFACFTGLLEGDDLVKAFQGAGFMVITSHYENLPVVIGEAFACGLPVMATTVGGIPEVVNDNNGLLVPPGDDLRLEQGLDYMLDHYHAYNRAEIRKEAISRFGKEAVTTVLQSVYNKALTSGSA